MGNITINSVPDCVGRHTIQLSTFSGYSINTKTLTARSTNQELTDYLHISSSQTVPTSIPQEEWSLSTNDSYYEYGINTTQNVLSEINEYLTVSENFSGTGKIRFTFRAVANRNGSWLGIQNVSYSTDTHYMDVTFANGDILSAIIKNMITYRRITSSSGQCFFVSASII